MKYLLVVFYLTTNTWPKPDRTEWAQLGPYQNILACESAARQVELIVKSIGADRVGTVCSQTVVR